MAAFPRYNGLAPKLLSPRFGVQLDAARGAPFFVAQILVNAGFINIIYVRIRFFLLCLRQLLYELPAPVLVALAVLRFFFLYVIRCFLNAWSTACIVQLKYSAISRRAASLCSAT